MTERRESREPTRILITGANGFVGRHLIAHLLAGEADAVQIIAAVHPDQILSSLRPDPVLGEQVGWTGGTADGRVEVVGLEMSDGEATAALVAEARPHQIYHLAARASGADADREAVFAVNVAGTRALLEAAAGLSPFPRALVISTGYVYGDTDPARPAREEDPVGPLWRYNAYTDSKIEMESVARAYRGFTLVARPFAHTGPGQAPVFALPAFARQLARIEQGLDPPELRVGNLEARRDLLDARDVVRAYTLLMAHGVPGEAYNVALGRPVSLRALLDQMRALCAVPTQVTVDPERLRSTDIACSTGDPLRLWMATSWKARLSQETTLRDTLDYWRAQTAALRAA